MDLIKIDKAWTTGLDITISCFFYVILTVYKNLKDLKSIEYIYLFNYKDNILTKPLMILINENFNHVKMRYPKQTIKENLNESEYVLKKL